MATVRIVDTSVFCNILAVPGRCQDHEDVIAELREFIDQGDTLLLPMAAVYETGNHIAHATTGRHQTAKRFKEQVQGALDGENPFEPTQIHDVDEVRTWLDDFPKHAAQGIGIGDRSIISVWEAMCERTPSRRVVIWAYDGDLSGYDRKPNL